MQLKKLDKTLDGILWVLFLALAGVALWWTISIKAPKLEYVESEKIPYVYTADDGGKYNSYYQLAWYHENFHKPVPVAADPNNGRMVTFKEEYVDEYKAMMTPSKYPFYTRWTWVIFALLLIADAMLVYFGGGAIRDSILYLKLKRHPDFVDCAYFLHETRWACEKKVKKLIADNVGEYVKKKSAEIHAKYREDFANLIELILRRVSYNEDTEVPFYLTYTNKTKDQKKYLAELRSYWDSQIGKDIKAESNIRAINEMIANGNYLSINLLLDESDILYPVAGQLDDLFIDIMGGEVLKFKAYKGAEYKKYKPEGLLFIDINVYNHTNTFTWSGDAVPSGTSIPGVEVEFFIYHFVKGVQTPLWRKFLVPKCSYTAQDKEFSSSELYKDMVQSTIRSFNDKR